MDRTFYLHQNNYEILIQTQSTQYGTHLISGRKHPDYFVYVGTVIIFLKSDSQLLCFHLTQWLLLAEGDMWNKVDIILAWHDDVIKWKHFPRYWPFVRRIHRSPVNSPHKGQWCGALMFSLICVWINGWENNREAGDLRRYLVHYDVTVMIFHNMTKTSKIHLKSFWVNMWILLTSRTKATCFCWQIVRHMAWMMIWGYLSFFKVRFILLYYIKFNIN